MPFKDEEKRKAYQRKYQKKYYERNRDKLIPNSTINSRNLRLSKKAWLFEKLGTKCLHCEYTNQDGLTFHHTDPSYKRTWGDVRPGQQKGSGVKHHRTTTDYSWKDLEAQVHTLEVLCANCHQVHHAEERRAAKEMPHK
tara:strand:- start:163 stop:579 length:417 start_codon:yes stop_codon:yes gene_type:complete